MYTSGRAIGLGGWLVGSLVGGRMCHILFFCIPSQQHGGGGFSSIKDNAIVIVVVVVVHLVQLYLPDISIGRPLR